MHLGTRRAADPDTNRVAARSWAGGDSWLAFPSPRGRPPAAETIAKVIAGRSIEAEGGPHAIPGSQQHGRCLALVESAAPTCSRGARGGGELHPIARVRRGSRGSRGCYAPHRARFGGPGGSPDCEVGHLRASGGPGLVRGSPVPSLAASWRACSCSHGASSRGGHPHAACDPCLEIRAAIDHASAAAIAVLRKGRTVATRPHRLECAVREVQVLGGILGREHVGWGLGRGA